MRLSIKELVESDKRPIELLKVVGFADRLSDHDYPIRNLPPIFQLPEKDLFIVPPFRLKGKFVVGGHIIASNEFMEFLQDMRITAFPPYRAKVGYSLWVDEEGTLGYESSQEVRQKFVAFVVKNYQGAKKAFDGKNFDRCIDLAEKVLGANVSPYQTHALTLMARAYRGIADGCEKLRDSHYQKHDAHPILKDGVWGSARALDARGATDALNLKDFQSLMALKNQRFLTGRGFRRSPT